MNTRIYESYADFRNRLDKLENGVSKKFAKWNPTYESDNETNLGCWNCEDCINCKNCEDCKNCYSCEDCKNSEDCQNCKSCTNCVELVNKTEWYDDCPL